jgi:carbon-monoxide dehydrogenase medium subunit
MMRPAEVSYVRALDLEDAGRLLKARGGGTRVIGGGQALLRDLRARELQVGALVDISRLGDLDYIRHEGDRLEIGAVTTLARVATDETVRAVMPALAEGARRVGDAQIRSWGTVGGNICGPWSPAGWSADIGTVLAASGGEVVVRSADGQRTTVDAVEFMSSDDFPLGPCEIITALRFGVAQGSAYYRLSRRWADASIGAAAAFVDVDGSEHPRVRVAVGRVHRRVVRLWEVESAIAAHGVAAVEVDEALAAVVGTFSVIDNVHADANYRISVFPVIVKRAAHQAITLAESATAAGGIA